MKATRSQDANHKEPNKVLHCHVLGTHAAVFILTMFLQYHCCVRQGEEYLSPALWLQKGDGDGTVDKLGRWTFTCRSLEVLILMFFLHPPRLLTRLQLVGGIVFCALRPSTYLLLTSVR